MSETPAGAREAAEVAELADAARLRVVVAGGHGQIALLAQRRLAAEGHRPIGLIRNPDHAADLRAVGAEPVVFDLETQTAAELAELVAGADALVFAAGAGPGSGPGRKMTVDRDGAILLADAADLAGIRRYVVVSAMAADEYVVGSEEVFQIYLRAKAEADEIVRSRDLDWTIVRPGGLTDEPATGDVLIAERTGRGQIPRDDVAAIVTRLVVDGTGIRSQFEVISGSTPIAEALAAL
ncbi:MAG TPA: SDR family oxidoreductase [Microlunatus sp.]|nr:SDR family oxidoreductase [Microlunatus sp.]